MKSILLTLCLTCTLMAQLMPGNEKGVSMGHLHFLVNDAEVHKKLWVDTLGAEVVHVGRIELFQFPGVQILVTQRPSSGGNAGTVLDHLGFRVQDLDDAKAKLTAAGVTLISESPGTRQMFLEFPDAIKIEFTEDTSLDQPIVHDHIHFGLPQTAEQRAWYAKMFGAMPGKSGRFEAADLPGVNLRWLTTEQTLPGIKGTSVDHIGFEVENLEEFCKQLEADGVTFNVPYRSVPSIGLSIAFLTDPWGVYIELTEGLARAE